MDSRVTHVAGAVARATHYTLCDDLARIVQIRRLGRQFKVGCLLPELRFWYGINLMFGDGSVTGLMFLLGAR